MNILNMIRQCVILINDANIELCSGNESGAEQQLVQLREYLNEQPELEAGGSKTERRLPK